jgi:metal-sulfur cluster biosynthetic enzyme
MGATDPRATTGADRIDREAVRARLDRVYDPELDRSIIDLEYVDRLEISDARVSIDFVLPTAWCSPAFAWMMATGIRDEVGSLPAVDEVTVSLLEHMHGEEINTGVNEGLAFDEVFEDADGGVDEIRTTLDEKARFARQFEAMRALRQAGLDDGQLAGLTRAAVDLDFRSAHAAVTVHDGALTVTAPREPLADYLAKARETGLVSAGSDPLFADRDGEPLDDDPDAVKAVYRDARLAASNIEGQGAICASLHESRNGGSSE